MLSTLLLAAGIAGAGAKMLSGTADHARLLDLGRLNHAPLADINDVKEKFNPKGVALPPVFYFSGLTASTITMDIKRVPVCNDTKESVTIWPLNQQDLSLGYECLLDAFKVLFDPKTNKYYDLPGFTPSTLNFGNMTGLSYGDGVAQVMEQLGWVEGVNLFGAPFDWRRTDKGHGTVFYPQLKALIEKAVTATGKKASLIAPSYGPQNVLGFLQQQNSIWKKKYIDWFIAESPVWSGTPIALDMMMSGYPLPDPASALLRTFLLDMPSIYWLFPRPGIVNNYLYSNDEVLISTPSTNYTAWDIPKLLKDLGLDYALPMYNDLLKLSALSFFNNPGVNTFVTYGTGLATPGSFSYKADFIPNPFVTPSTDKEYSSMEAGDSLVPLRSLLRSTEWAALMKAQGLTLLHREYPKQTHATCLMPLNTTDKHVGTVECFTDVLSVIVYGTLPPVPPTGPPTPAPPTPAPGGPCDICTGSGACNPCTQCESMKDGPCAPCWADNDGFSCLPFCQDNCWPK